MKDGLSKEVVCDEGGLSINHIIHFCDWQRPYSLIEEVAFHKVVLKWDITVYIMMSL